MKDWRHDADIYTVSQKKQDTKLFQHISGVVEYLNMSLVQIYHWVCQRKNFENRLTFGEVMGKSLVSCLPRDAMHSRY